MQNTELLTVANGGIQAVPPESPLLPQIIYLDFDGELTNYHNRDLDIHIDDVEVEDSGLTDERIAALVNALNDDFATQNVVFVTDRPTDTVFSTIYVGKTSNFDDYGTFAGLAETVDVGNNIRNDNAFVMLDSTTDNAAIVKTISHEAKHLIGTLEHEGESIGRYADGGYVYYYYLNNQTIANQTFSGSNASLYVRHKEQDITMYSSGFNYTVMEDTYVCKGYYYQSAYNVTFSHGAALTIESGGFASSATLLGARTYIYNNGLLKDTQMSAGSMWIYDGGVANYTTMNPNAYMGISSGGTANNTVLNGGLMYVGGGWGTPLYGIKNCQPGGTANNTIVNSGGVVYVVRGNVANGVTVNIGGTIAVLNNGTATAIKENGGFVSVCDGASATFMANAFSDLEISYCGSMTLHSGTTANRVTVNSKGSAYIYSGGVANETILNRGCQFIVYSGGEFNSTTINGGWLIDYGGNANSTTISNGGLEIYSGGTASCSFVNGGSLIIQNGVANSTTVNSGGSLYIGKGSLRTASVSSGGGITLGKSSDGIILEDKIVLGGTMTTSGAVTASDTEIIFDLTQRHPNEGVMVDNLANLTDAAFSISVLSSQEAGNYRLANGAADYHDNVVLTIANTGEQGEFTWQEDGYSSVLLNGKYYTLEKSKGQLCLGVTSLPKISVDFSIDEVGQVEYYNGAGSEKFTTTVLKVPYVATATVTIDKNTPDGEYTLTTYLDEFEDAAQDFKLQVIDGMPSYDNEYISACHYGEYVGETNETTTWRFNRIDGYLLTDKADSSMPIGVRTGYGNASQPVIVDGTLLQFNSTNNVVSTVRNGESDANKDGYYLLCDYVFQDSMQNVFMIHIEPYDLNEDNYYDNYLITIEVTSTNKCFNKVIDLFTFNGDPTGIDISISTPELGYDLLISNQFPAPILYKIDSIKCQKEEIGSAVSYNIEKHFAKNHLLHCWVATAANMLYRGGYLPANYTAQQCFEDLSKAYVKKAGASQDGYATHVLCDLNLRWDLKDYKDISEGLQHFYNNNGTEVVAAIDLNGKDIGHEITCYSIESLSEKYALIRYADSDWDIDKVTIKYAELVKKGWFTEYWYMKYEGKEVKIDGFYTLIGRTDGTPTIDITSFTSKPVGKQVSARNSTNVSSVGSTVVVYGSITGGVVEEEGELEIADGAVADTLYIHTNATARFNAGAQVTGKVLTYGGTLSVASGADVSETEINFNLVQMATDNDVMLDNLHNALTADFTVTIGSDQTAGRYLLADGAASFDGDVTVCGEVYGYYSVRPGFVDGELGTLAVGETLEVANQVYSLSVEGDTLVFTVAWASLCVLSVETDCTYLTEEPVTVTAVFSEDIVRPEYSYDGETWVEYVDGVAMADNGFVWFRGFDSGGKQSEVVRHEVYNIIHSYSIDGGDENGLNLPESASNQLLVLTYDDYNHSLQVEVDTDRVNLHALPNGRYSWKVRDVDDVEWSVGNEITVDNQEQTRLLSAVNDGNVDAFFGNARGVWSAYYRARHVGVGEWNGTGEFVQLSDKNRIEDIFAGSDDASILLLTDDENGDALFVDDIFSAFPDGLDAQSRIAKIDEIRAGAGNDIIDLTSQRFEYVGNGLTVKGGLGDDVIWANKGDNLLFGDAGDDRLVGAAGNDVIVGGKGDDSLHGGGGDDIFAFGLGWGSDTIEQREGGSTLLWFGYNVRAEISLSADGAGNAVLSSDSGSVTLLGIKHDDLSEVFASCSNDLLDGLSLRFGDDGSDLYSDLLVEGAFDGFTSKKVFEDTSKGILT